MCTPFSLFNFTINTNDKQEKEKEAENYFNMLRTEFGDDLIHQTVTPSENEKPIWFKTPYGYCFSFADNGKTYYNITFNTLTNVLLYEESSD